MPDLHKQSNDGDGPLQKPKPQPPNLLNPSALIPNPQRRKHWAKQYRTEIAASSSSLLSTFAAHFADCVRHTFKTEGFKGFWRGM
ncbi:MAG: hypothetical protein Q9171_000636 [Xanthocarpia ochracea]